MLRKIVMLEFFKKKRKKIFFNQRGIFAVLSKENHVIIDWNKINKVVLTNVFEEYSGYFLTEEYKEKKLYHSIFMDCSENLVKFNRDNRRVLKNASEPFSVSHGKTILFSCYFVEYTDSLGRKNLYVSNYKRETKEEKITELKTYLSSEQIVVKDKLHGFHELYTL